MDNSYLIRLLKEISDIMSENRDHLIEMDSIVGDGDLGLTMGDGFKAAYEKVADGSITDAGKLYTRPERPWHLRCRLRWAH